MLEGLKLNKPTAKQLEPVRPKFNFDTARRANGSVKKIDWLEGKTQVQVVDMWKRAHCRKKLTIEEAAKFEEVKYYLKNKFNMELPK